MPNLPTTDPLADELCSGLSISSWALQIIIQ